jgi:hypothetical protein
LRPKKCLLALQRRLREVVASKLILEWSPEQISGWLKTKYPKDERMRGSPDLTTFCFAGFGADRLRCQEAMETAGRENPKRWAIVPSNRALGAVGQNNSRSIRWAAKQGKFQPKEKCFFLTSTFIELIGT